ncbi:MAG: histidinol-phosphate transaminase [Porphyromonadaceae bacterium]|nr:histidinol-phosphate transaminase [Porphyromonadaceae bacterium]
MKNKSNLGTSPSVPTYKKLEELLRKNILNLTPYSSARDEFTGDASVFLDANESPFNPPYNRYPDPLQRKLKEKISEIKHVRAENIFLGNGSDEAIDLVYRAFCEPRTDNVVAIEPTYGMYKVSAEINDIEYRKVLLDSNFQINVEELLKATDAHTKVIWICSPNNPTGNLINSNDLVEILERFHGIVVIDEAYIDFADQESFIYRLDKYPNLIILQTFSKAWGSAAIRLGMAFASIEIIQVFNKIKYPYNVNQLTQNKALEALENVDQVAKWVELILHEREQMFDQLSQLKMVRHIYPTDANFLLIQVENPNEVYKKLVEKGIIIRNRSTVSLCGGCLRITIGEQTENMALIEELKKIDK